MVTRRYDAVLRPLGLTVNQLNILATVVSQTQMQPVQLGRVLAMEKSTISRTVERMAKKGWLDIGPGQDGRSQLLKASPAGRQLLVKAAPIWETLQTEVLESLADSNLLGNLGLDQSSGAAEDPEEDWATDFYS
jgi:DNA-binding MarR family transcriptional regulator